MLNVVTEIVRTVSSLSLVQCEVGELYDPATRQCQPSESVQCGPRRCSDEARCPCINYDQGVEEDCPDTTQTFLFPDMRECARYLNCTAGCFTSVLVTLSQFSCNDPTSPILSAPTTGSTTTSTSGAPTRGRSPVGTDPASRTGIAAIVKIAYENCERGEISGEIQG